MATAFAESLGVVTNGCAAGLQAANGVNGPGKPRQSERVD